MHGQPLIRRDLIKQPSVSAEHSSRDSIDIDLVRAHTPGVQNRVHFNNAGSALMPECVVRAVTEHIELESQIGGYEAADEKQHMLDELYLDVAALIGAQAEEIAIMDNATVAWDHAFYALPFKAGDRILTSQAEYAANYVAFLQRAHKESLIIDVVPNDDSGALDVDALREMVDERVALIAITWIPTNGGFVNPAAAVGEIAKRFNIPYLLDACQALGQMPVDVRALGCDFLSATGRKFLRGPRGTGFLYVRKALIEALQPVMIDHFAADWVMRDTYALRGDARRFENWENAYALRMGLRAAVRYAQYIGLGAIQQRAWALAARLRERLQDIGGIKLHDAGAEKCAIVSFSINGFDALKMKRALTENAINISVSSPSSTLLDAQDRRLPALLRASPHYYNTESELDCVVDAIESIRSR
jgi:cysteine desulfurase/selenocysteine lyase